MRKIILTQGKSAMVDDADFPVVSQFKWFAQRRGKTFYASRNAVSGSKRTVIYMHRAILRPRKGQLIDHIDMNGLNNCRANLRFSNASLNALNQKGHCDSILGVRGVQRSGKKYLANIRNKYLGTFDTIEEAQKAVSIELKNICK